LTESVTDVEFWRWCSTVCLRQH